MSDTAETQVMDNPAPSGQAGSATTAAESAPTQTKEAVLTPGKSWRDDIPEEFRNDPSIASLKDVGDMAKTLVNAQKLIGREKVPVPKGDDDKEGWDRLYKIIGRPDTPQDYEFALPESAPFQLDKEKVSGWQTFMHEHGVSAKTAKAMFEKYVSEVSGEMTQHTEAQAKDIEERLGQLKEQWGEKFQPRAEVARAAVEQFGSEDFRNWLSDSGLGNDPRMVELFYRIGERMSEDRAVGSGTGAFITNAASAQREIENLKMDREFMDLLLKQRNKAANERWQSLHRIAYPERAAS